MDATPRLLSPEVILDCAPITRDPLAVSGLGFGATSDVVEVLSGALWFRIDDLRARFKRGELRPVELTTDGLVWVLLAGYSARCAPAHLPVLASSPEYRRACAMMLRDSPVGVALPAPDTILPPGASA